MNPSPDPRIQKEIALATQWRDQSRSLLDEIQVVGLRLRISSTCHRISIEHQMAILLLAEQNIMVSAKALLRPQFDAFARGVWFRECATDLEIQAFLDKGEESRIPPKYGILFKGLDSVARYGDSFFSRFYREHLPDFHDFTHGGLHQIAAFNSADSIESNFSPEDVLGTLRTSATLGLLACNELAGNCQRDDLARQVYQSFQIIYGSNANIIDGLVPPPEPHE